MKKIITILITLLITISCLTSCKQKDTRNNDIVILFTNDIHCGIEDNITLAGVAGYKKYQEAKSKYVALVDCGDAIQGSYIGAVSKGEAVIQAMNVVGYDIATFGNHEFDYGIPRLMELIGKANAEYINCNITYSGKNENAFKDIKPYVIKTFGKTKIAFIGIDTPDTIKESTPVYFQEDGEYVYGFSHGNNGQDLYDVVQKNVDEARSKGADYVIAMGHLGILLDEDSLPYTAPKVIENTTGIDVFLDGHSHSTYVSYCTKNKDGKYVVSCQTGTKLTNLGQLVISEGGTITISNINDIKDVDESVKTQISDISAKYNEMLNVKIGYTPVDLSITDKDGVRIVRDRETNVADLCADSIRYATGADIAYTNGGGVRETIKAGDVTYKDIISVNPFGNMLCTVELTGQDILDMLEFFVKHTQAKYVEKDGVTTIGESGSFPCISGIKFTINTSIPTSIVVDKEDMLVSVGDTRRVSDVLVLENNEYVPIDPNKTYVFASTDYTIKNSGNGMGNIMKGKKVLIDGAISDYEALIKYITEYLKGDLSPYSEVDSRIYIK